MSDCRSEASPYALSLPLAGEGRRGGGPRRTVPTSSASGKGVRPRWRFGLIAAILFLALAPAPAYAVQPDEVLADPALESRARNLSLNLRCLVCQNQSIDDSDAPLARDLRILVRERLKAGDSDAEVIDFVVARYGEFVLLNPRVRPSTYVLWLAPGVILVFGGLALWAGYRRRRPAPERAAPLSEQEKEALDKVLRAP
jgi:cytochrome c-type biogenesis protein CcmH